MRVRVKNDENRTLTATLATRRPSATTSRVSSLASTASCSSTSDRSVRSCGNVVSRLRERATQGAPVTWVSAPPSASCRYHGPIVGPNRSANSPASARASWPTVSSPAAASFLAVLAPMPHSASVGRSAMTAIQLSSVSRYIPAGLAKPVASFARCLLSPMPTEQDSPVAAVTARRTAAANPSGSSVRAPRNASSQP